MLVLLKNLTLRASSTKCSVLFHHFSQAHGPTICIVGSGPAGFGISQYLLKNHDLLRIKMIEKCPIPYGLIRYGVSPDHQDVKNCIHGYERVAENPRFSFYGNVDVGSDITLSELHQVSDAVVLCTGAQKLLQLGIPGEDLPNVFSAKEFVGWYNGVPQYNQLKPDLSGSTAAIIGVGNVALDCARMLLKPHEELKDTDITTESYEALKTSNIKNVILIGRRGPLQMTCTRKELSEITDIANVTTIADQKCFTDAVKTALKIKNLKLRKTQRLVKHLMTSMTNSDSKADSETNQKFVVKLLRSPEQIIEKNGAVCGVTLKKNFMTGEDAFKPDISYTNETENIDCSLVISAIGYGNETIEETIPFIEDKIMNNGGRVDHAPPLYACGWCKNGAKGVLADTLNDCLITGKTLLTDLKTWEQKYDKNKGKLDEFLVQKQIKSYSWDDWRIIDKYETDQGIKLGKVREKVVHGKQMSEIINAKSNDVL
ncbi:NADPH:adrenodoxin oxidoreductase, mitochondrial-like [Styela clava]